MRTSKRDDDEGIGYIREILTTGRFSVELLSGRTVLCYLAGIARSKKVRFSVGDRVRVELEGYHGKKGRITYRYRDIQPEDDTSAESIADTQTPDQASDGNQPAQSVSPEK